jgi:2,4'-dihydroxyacetophenone dioxygenase
MVSMIIMPRRKFDFSFLVVAIHTWLTITGLLVENARAWCQAPSFVMNNKSAQHCRRMVAQQQEQHQSESKRESINNNAYEPYAGEQPKEALAEIFVRQVLPSTASSPASALFVDDERLWVPQTDCVSFRPLCLCVSGGYYVNLLRVRGSGLLSRHRHPGPVHGHVLQGKWKYLEHEWEAVPGSYIFEPPGEIHTLVVPEGVDEMITLFHVTGALLYCDVNGNVTGAEDVFTKLELAKKHYAQVGLGEDFVQQFVR